MASTVALRAGDFSVPVTLDCDFSLTPAAVRLIHPARDVNGVHALRRLQREGCGAIGESVKSEGHARIEARAALAAAAYTQQSVRAAFVEHGAEFSSSSALSHDAAAAVRRWPVAPSRILICRPNARLGNTLLLTPLVQEIEAAFPGAELDILTACPSAAEIFREFSCINTLYQLPRNGVHHPWRLLAALLRASRASYDVILDPCPKSWSSRFVTHLLRGRLKLGFCSPEKTRDSCHCVPIEQAPSHMAAYPVYLFRNGMAGCAGDRAGALIPRLSIELTARERNFGRRKLRQLTQAPGLTPILAVATRATGAKEFPLSWWREMLTLVAVKMPHARIVEILSATGAAQLPEYSAYLSTRLRRLAAVINAADCFVSADSGLMHLGAATATPTIGLFKVTEPSVYAPYGGLNRALRVDDQSLPCVADEIGRMLQETRRAETHPDRIAPPIAR